MRGFMGRGTSPTCRVLFLVAMLASCKSGSKTQPREAPKDAAVVHKPPAVIHLPEPKLELPRQHSFELIAPGAAPREPLRYTLAPGVTQHLTTTKLRSRRLADGTWGPATDLPAITVGFAVTVEADKPAQLRALTPKVAKPSPEADAYLASWRELEGHQLGMPIDARGRLGKLTTDETDENRRDATLDDLAQRLLVTIVPLPDEPVGIGAKWRSVTILRQRPALVKQTATYTLRARTAKSWKIDVEIQRVGEEQVVTSPDLPEDAAANILAVGRKLEGTVTVIPGALFPTGKLSVDSIIHMRIATADRKVYEQILEDVGTVELFDERR